MRYVRGHDAIQCQQRFEHFSRSGDANSLRDLRASVFEGTLSAVRLGAFVQKGLGECRLPASVVLDHSVKNARVYGARELSSYSPDSASDDASTTCERRLAVDVMAQDMVEAAMDLLSGPWYPCLLNMANATSPGGSVELGIGAQEEELCRRSNLLLSLQRLQDDGLYPLPAGGAAYSPSVCFFRTGGAQGYAWVRPRAVGVVSVAAMILPKRKTADAGTWLPEGWDDYMSNAIFAILATAQLHQHDAIVLSAFGCGEFCNPPAKVARLFRQQLELPRFRNHFKKVCFAILDEHGENYRAFAQEFNCVSSQQ